MAGESKAKRSLNLRERRRILIKRLKGFWGIYKKERLGVIGLGMLTFFILISLAAPLLTTYEPFQTSRVASPFSAPAWARVWDSNSFDDIESALPNPEFASGSAFWDFGVTNGLEDVINGSIVDDPASESGAFRITVDNTFGNISALEGAQANITSFIPWGNTKRPAQIFVYVKIRAILTGDYTVGDFEVDFLSYNNLRGRLEQVDEVNAPFGEDTYIERRLSYVSVELTTHFLNNPDQVPVAIQISEISPDVNGTISVFIDGVRIQIRDRYHGILGTTNTGADAFSQLIYGTRVSIVIGILATGIAIAIGLLVGLVSGYFGGRVDEILMRVVDFLLVIPRLPLLLVLATILGPSFTNIILIIGLLGWDGTARLIRSQVLAEKNKAYVESARAIGASDTYIIFRHVMPNVTPLLFVNITLGVVNAILSEAGLSFLGLGDPSIVSWGIMLQNAFNGGGLTAGAWWFIFPPGLGILFLSLAFTFIGYAVDTVLNPRLRTR